MAQIWDTLPGDRFLSLAPWAWIQLEAGEAPGPFPFLGGVAPDVVASLQEAHSLMLSGVETAVSDVFAGRAPLEDARRRERLEDAYAELINSRPHLSQHITARREAGGNFLWDYPKDPTRSSTMTNAGVRIFHSVKRQAVPMPFE